MLLRRLREGALTRRIGKRHWADLEGGDSMSRQVLRDEGLKSRNWHVFIDKTVGASLRQDFETDENNSNPLQ